MTYGIRTKAESIAKHATNTLLLLYLFMYGPLYGPNWDNPCPSCTSQVDGFGSVPQASTLTLGHNQYLT